MEKRFHKSRILLVVFLGCLLVTSITTYSLTYSEITTATDSTNSLSGISNNVITIDDALSDKYYYNSLNFTTSSTGTLPSGNDQNIYHDSNMVKVTITYSGEDINDSTLIGYTSLSERQNTYVYHKYYPIVDNYVTIELIDNPFTDRPTNMGFNGWTTDYANATISFDKTYYTRYAKIYVSDNSDINITFHASWVEATVASIYNNNNNAWTTAFNNLEDGVMKVIGGERYPIYEDVSNYYVRYTIRSGEPYPSGAVNNRGNSVTGNCNPGFFSNSCTYYVKSQSSEYDSSLTYYELGGGFFGNTMSTHTVSVIGYGTTPYLSSGTKTSGYYKAVPVARNATFNRLYDRNGNYYESGRCNTSGGCTYYELIQYYDNNGDINVADGDTGYYYLVTRDTNIIVMKSNNNYTWNSTKPFTLTSIYNGENYTNSVTWNVSDVTVRCYNDTRIENIRINSEASDNTNQPVDDTYAYGYILGNYNNLKIGRGITQVENYKTFNGVIGGDNEQGNEGNSSNTTKYQLIVESGFYNTITLTNGPDSTTSYNKYIEAKAIYGNDYDRIAKTNDNLDVYYVVSGSWGGGNYYADNSQTGILFDSVVKSGNFGSSKYDHTSGIYIGGRGYGKHYAAKRIKVEGGWIYNLIGGPLSGNDRSSINDVYVYMTGGEVSMVVGGAGTSATYGNRIISITGGTVDYSVFGGSNGYDGSDGDGTLNGSSLVYIGGNATIGSADALSDTDGLWNAEAGSVFGIGNGKEGISSMGSNDNSNIIINEKANIKNNVYGGGNFGATGYSSSTNTNTTNIWIRNGIIEGSVYGGGNNNGAGSETKTATVNVNMSGGTIYGYLYGGSNKLGTVYGDVNVNVTGGLIKNSVYGGGEGGYASSDAIGTYVTGNVNVTIGEPDADNGLVKINKSVYGGSAFGCVNGSTNTTNVSSSATTVTINSGTITNVYGGGEGDNTYTPYVEGNVTVNVNNGIIENVFGGNDFKGTPNGSVTVNIHNGTVTNAYGGGNQASVNEPYLNLLGGTVTNAYGGGNRAAVTTSHVLLDGSSCEKVFGGSNASGDVTSSNVVCNSGSSSNVFGGNNQGGTTATTNVTINDGTITNVYGGGEKTDVTTAANVTINGTVVNAYGGSDSDGIVKESFVTLKGTATDVYGGNNLGGTTTTSNVTIDQGRATNVYGGGKKADTVTSNVNLLSGTIDNIFGGGSEAGVTTTNVNLNKGIVTNVFGGSNTSGTVGTSYIKNKTSQANTGDYTELRVTNVFGGNNQGGTTNTTNVELTSGNIDNVYGGGEKATSNLTNVIISGATINNIVYGGGDNAKVTTDTNVTINNNATISGKVYGGGNAGEVEGNTNVNIVGSTVIDDVYGGGNQASVKGNTNIILESSTISKNAFGGGNNGMVLGDTNVDVKNSTINKSVYAGGNGSTAIVLGNTLLDLEGTTTVSDHVFGGGNAAATGCDTNILNNNSEVIATCSNANSSTSIVNIAGANIGHNVYGGANTSVLYGETYLNIGIDTIDSDLNLIPGNIEIGGTVFGGGEANASGSEDYDFSFISVTEGININIDANNHNTFNIEGSIFGSGNASSSGGYSYINIKNYGTRSAYKKNVSIQRTDIVTIDNSNIELAGATDRTNKYKSELFTLSRIGELKLANNSTLYLDKGTNLLEKFSSLLIENGKETKEEVTINSDEKTVTKNVDNRLYIIEGKNINISDDESLATYGDVNGMAFFGMFTIDRNGNVSTALYDDDYDYGDSASGSDLYYFSSGSYVVGKHKNNHDVYEDGFYTNYANKEDSTIKVDYIIPTPDNASYYRWVVGESVDTLELSLTASKYSTLGTYELQLLDFYEPNTEIDILGVNCDDLNSDINLLSEKDIPRHATSADIANTNFGLAFETGTSGWITNGKTELLTNSDKEISGTTIYKSENSNAIPSFIFYLYHSKNLTVSKELGSVTISMMVITPINDLSNNIKRVNVVVNLKTALYEGDSYEATISPGDKYSMFANNSVNITNKSTFSAYFSLYANSDTNIYESDYYRTLISSYALPENTKITMIDLANDNPEYYYYIINSSDYADSLSELDAEGEVSYRLSKFVRMGSPDSNNNYNDSIANNNYYDSTAKKAEEEFIFIVDLKDTNLDSDVLGESLLIELKRGNKQPIPVLDIEQQKMVYNLYNDKDAVIEASASLSEDTVYIGKTDTLTVLTNFRQQTTDSINIIDTNFYNQKLGIKITILDSEGNIVNGAGLLGLSYLYDGVTYYPRVDGTTRFNIAERVANVSSKIVINTENSNLATGDYVIKIDTFGSSDGIYYGLESSSSVTVDLKVINDIYGLDVELSDNSIIIDKDTGYTKNNTNDLDFNVNYSSGLNNPNLRLSLYRRTYTDIYDYTYELVPLGNIINEELEETNNSMEYLFTNNPNKTNRLILHTKENLTTGTYRFEFKLYDNNNYIGSAHKDIIIE